MKGIPYSPEEEEVLKAGFASGKSDRAIARELTASGRERTSKSVKIRRCALKLFREDHGPNRTNASYGEYWNSQAIASDAFAKALRAAGVKETVDA